MYNKLQQLRKETGSTAVEVALALPLIILLIFGIIDFGRFYWAKHSVTSAANEAARMAILADVTPAEITGIVSEQLQHWSAQETVEILETAASDSAPATVTITVSLPFNFFVIPDLGGTALGSHTITHSVTMRSEK